MKVLKFFLIILSFLVLSVKPIQAIVDPLSVPNNRFGIHVLEVEDFKPAADLVNTQGGDWGYVTLIIRQNDRNPEKWQAVFNALRRLHLIPIVRLATQAENNYWVKPKPEDVASWVDFLNSLNWVIQNRYLVLFNEPNHAAEWGNTINPAEYAAIVRDFHDQLKAASPDFFILPAGLDTAAPNSKITLSAPNYWQQMYSADVDIFTLFDGLNSHSYPNPGFSGSPQATGLGTLQSYLAEQTYLTRFGLPSNLPVFITETGWTHKDGRILGASDPDNLALSRFYRQAYTQIWTQSNLVAVTPFILNYPAAPFAEFSWQIPNSKDFYPHYFAVTDLTKTAGQPVQIHQSQLISNDIPQALVDSSHYQLNLKFKNTGQSIWNPTDFSVNLTGNFSPELFQVGDISVTEPGQTLDISFTLTTPAFHDSRILGLQLKFKDKTFGEKFEQNIQIVPPPTLITKVKLLFKSKPTASDFNLLVYDSNEKLQQEIPLEITAGQSQPLPLYNLIPNQLYRFVVLKPQYFPRQIIAILNPDQTTVTFKTMFPSLKNWLKLIF